MFNIIICHIVFTIFLLFHIIFIFIYQFITIKIYISMLRILFCNIEYYAIQLTNNFKLMTPTRTNVSSSNDSCLSTKCENFTLRFQQLLHLFLFLPQSPSSPRTPTLKSLIQDTWCMADSNPGAVVYRDSRKAR